MKGTKMNSIVISPYSSKLKGVESNPKDYPYWNELTFKLKEIFTNKIIQIGIRGEERLQNTDVHLLNKPLSELLEILHGCYFWISVDNFFHHFAHYYNKPGFVLFGLSDPRIFGYKENYNIFRSKNFFRPDQFRWWIDCPKNEESFVSPETVIRIIKRELNI